MCMDGMDQNHEKIMSCYQYRIRELFWAFPFFNFVFFSMWLCAKIKLSKMRNLRIWEQNGAGMKEKQTDQQSLTKQILTN